MSNSLKRLSKTHKDKKTTKGIDGIDETVGKALRSDHTQISIVTLKSNLKDIFELEYLCAEDFGHLNNFFSDLISNLGPASKNVNLKGIHDNQILANLTLLVIRLINHLETYDEHFNEKLQANNANITDHVSNLTVKSKRNSFSSSDVSTINKQQAVNLKTLKKTIQNIERINPRNHINEILEKFALVAQKIDEIYSESGLAVMSDSPNFIRCLLMCLSKMDIDKGSAFKTHSIVIQILIKCAKDKYNHEIIYEGFKSLGYDSPGFTLFQVIETILRNFISNDLDDVILYTLKFCDIFVNQCPSIEKKFYIQYAFKEIKINEIAHNLKRTSKNKLVKDAARTFLNNQIRVESFSSILIENTELKSSIVKYQNKLESEVATRERAERFNLGEISRFGQEESKNAEFVANITKEIELLLQKDPNNTELLRIKTMIMQRAQQEPGLKQVLVVDSGPSELKQLPPPPSAPGLPPPPGGGLPPPPGGGLPPPPLAIAKKIAIPENLKDLHVVNLTHKMPFLDWAKVNIRDLKESIFTKLDVSKMLKLYMPDTLHSIFELIPTRKIEFVQEEKKISTYTSPLSRQRSQNISICIRPYSGDVSRVKVICALMNSEHEDSSILVSMISSLPTVDEKKIVKEVAEKWLKEYPDKSISDLPLADKYVYEISSIADVENQLNIVLAMQEFEEDHFLIKDHLDANFVILKEMTNSKLPEIIYAIILVLGNHFNSQKRGITYGFFMRSLDRLSSFKSKTYEGVTLIHAVAQILVMHFGHVLDNLASQYETLKIAAKLDMNEISVKLKELAAQVETARKEADKRSLSQNKSDEDVEFIDKVVKMNESLFQLSETFKITQEKLTSFRKIFCEKQDAKSSELLGYWLKFYNDLTLAIYSLKHTKLGSLFNLASDDYDKDEDIKFDTKSNNKNNKSADKSTSVLDLIKKELDSKIKDLSFEDSSSDDFD